MRGLFFNAQPTTDIVAHPSGFDREYDGDDFNRYMGVFFGNGVFVRNDPDACKVTAAGLSLTVKPGVMLLDGSQCHFEEGDGLIISQGDGLYSIMCRRNNAAGVRAFELVAVKGSGSFPDPVRGGDVYDLCLAHVTATSSSATVADTRGDGSVCGFAALTGQPPYYPPDDANLPYVLWLYTLGYPMTAQQKAAVEGNPSLMAIYNQTRLAPATKAQAEEGADNTKVMTPLRTKEAIGTARETVLDTFANKLIRVRSKLKTVGVGPVIAACATAQYPYGVAGKYMWCVNEDANTLMTTGRYTTGNLDKRLYVSNIAAGENTLASIRTFYTGSTDYPDSAFEIMKCVSQDGSLAVVYDRGYNANNGVLVDTKQRLSSARVSLDYIRFCFSSPTVWGYHYIDGYSNRRFYYGVPSNEGTFSSVDIPGGTSSYYTVEPIGVYNNVLFFIERTDSGIWQLGKFDLTSKVVTRSLAIFNSVSPGWGSVPIFLKLLFHDARYSYLLVYSNSTACPKVLKVDMSGPSSNWVSLPALSSLIYTAFESGAETPYLGTIGTNAYLLNYKYSNLLSINKNTAEISFSALGGEMPYSSADIVAKNISLRERVVSIPGYENQIPYDGMLIDVEKSLASIMFHGSKVRYDTNSSSYFEILQGYSINQVSSLAFVGTVVDRADILMAAGSVEKSGKRYYSFAGGTPEFTLSRQDIP